MLDKKIVLILVSTVVAIAGLIWWGLQDAEVPTPDDPSAIVYYYGSECPHCKVVEAWLDENNIAEKVTYTKKEVWHNTKNASELERRAKVCNIQPEGMGVPFVYGGNGQCYVGEPGVKKFFSEKAGIEIPVQSETAN